MLNSTGPARLGGRTGRAAGVVLALVFAAAIAPGLARAIEMTTLYTAQVVLDPEQADPRAAAYEAALYTVLLRVAGTELAANPDLVAELFPRPAAYVVQFQPGPDDTLWVSFDGGAVERTLRDAGQTVWGTDRPMTLVWLAVDWGDGEREVVGADDAEQGIDDARSIDRNRLLRERILAAAERRGLPVVLPLLDTDDLRNVSFSDIWGGFDDQLLEASRRYDARSVLVGRVRPDTSQHNRWSYYFGDQQQMWNGEPEAVVDLVADTLADEFAIRGDAPVDTLELGIAGVDSVAAFGAVDRILKDLRIIERIAIVEVAGDRVLYRVEARGGSERLRRALRFSGLIEQNAGFDGRFAPDSAGVPLEYFYSSQ